MGPDELKSYHMLQFLYTRCKLPEVILFSSYKPRWHTETISNVLTSWLWLYNCGN